MIIKYYELHCYENEVVCCKQKSAWNFFNILLYFTSKYSVSVFQFCDFVSLCRVYRLYGSTVDTRLYANCTSAELLLSSKITSFYVLEVAGVRDAG
jgi:hypothetical protein